MSLTEARKTYKPFEYPWAYDFWKRQQQIHWMPEEVPLGEDCRDWAQNLTDHERNLLTQIFRFFTQADVEVQDCYHDKYGRVFKPTEIKMMLAAFSNMETVHIAAYSHLLDTIGMPESEYGMFLEYEEMKAKHDYMQDFGVDTDEDIARRLAMFGGFHEVLQLFASCSLRMPRSRRGRFRRLGRLGRLALALAHVLGAFGFRRTCHLLVVIVPVWPITMLARAVTVLVPRTVWMERRHTVGSIDRSRPPPPSRLPPARCVRSSPRSSWCLRGSPRPDIAAPRSSC